MSKQSKAVLELRNITKTFPGVKALDNVSLTLREGTVLAVIGENGAGKSTLIKVITGVYRPEAGEIFLNGKPVSFENTHAAFDRGISVVHQERNLCETFTVAENIFLEQLTRKPLNWVRMRDYNKQAEKYLELVGLDMAPTTNVTSLKSGQQQLLEIARALSMDAKIIMLDEPTASISVMESDMLLEQVDSLRKKGYSFIFVSHKLDEVFYIADDIMVIRDGRNPLTVRLHEESDDRETLRDKVITAMVGRAESKKVFPEQNKQNEPVVLEANEIVGNLHHHPFSFKLHKGEIFGWYGLVGAGRTELARELIGVDCIVSGTLSVNGKSAIIKDPCDAMHRYGIAYISENRNEEGVFVSHELATNISASVLSKISGLLGLVRCKAENNLADSFIQRLSIKTPHRRQLVVNLSGGNRQKVSVAKILAAEPKILIFDEPSVGIDIKTKDEIHDMIVELARSGISIILISSDMKEMIKVADRIAVFHEAKLLCDMPNNKRYAEMSERIIRTIMGKQM